MMSILEVEENVCVQRPDRNCVPTASRAATREDVVEAYVG